MGLLWRFEGRSSDCQSHRPCVPHCLMERTTSVMRRRGKQSRQTHGGIKSAIDCASAHAVDREEDTEAREVDPRYQAATAPRASRAARTAAARAAGSPHHARLPTLHRHGRANSAVARSTTAASCLSGGAVSQLKLGRGGIAAPRPGTHARRRRRQRHNVRRGRRARWWGTLASRSRWPLLSHALRWSRMRSAALVGSPMALE
jgi:hypothetical protein